MAKPIGEMTVEKFDDCFDAGGDVSNLFEREATMCRGQSKTFGLAIEVCPEGLVELGASPSTALLDIKRKLEAEGFTLARPGVFLYSKPTNAMDFALLARRLFSSCRHARAIKDLRCFELNSHSSLVEEVHEGNEDAVKLGKDLWP